MRKITMDDISIYLLSNGYKKTNGGNKVTFERNGAVITLSKNANQIEIDNVLSFVHLLNGIPISEIKSEIDNCLKKRGLSKVNEEELNQIFDKCKEELMSGGKFQPIDIFNHFAMILYCKIIDEKTVIDGNYQFRIYECDDDFSIEKRINDLVLRAKVSFEIDFEIVNIPINTLKKIIGYLQFVSLLATDLDCKGRAFERFIDSYFRGNFGQFFTPRNMVKFITDVLPLNPNSKIIDTSCGSGGFLMYSLDSIRNQFDGIDAGKFAQSNLFGIEVNTRIAQIAKMNISLHDGEQKNIISLSGLNTVDEIRTQSKNENFVSNGFDFVITNPPFGSIVKKESMNSETNGCYYYDFSTKEQNLINSIVNPKKRIEKRENQASEILFIEQAYKFLKPNGYLAIVLPDSITTSSSLQYVRDWIEIRFQIVAVVSFPIHTFAHVGAGVKTSVFILKKYTEEQVSLIKDTLESSKSKLSNDFRVFQTMNEFELNKRAARKHHALDKDSLDNELSEIESEKENFIEKIESLYLKERQKLMDYPIFMANAKNIGYDATGKATGKNDLPVITEELRNFIKSIEEGTFDFFD